MVRWDIGPRRVDALRIGADNDGKLIAIDHHTKTASSRFDDFFEPASDASHTLCEPAIATSHEAVRADTGTPLFMRAPGEATGSIALESAIDEMAQAYGMDPLVFRLRNYAEVEPISGKPFSSKRSATATAKVPTFRLAGASTATTANAGPRRIARWLGPRHGKIPGVIRGPRQSGAASGWQRHHETGAQEMGQGSWTALLRSPRIISDSTSTTSFSGPGPPTFRMPVSRAAPPIRDRGHGIQRRC